MAADQWISSGRRLPSGAIANRLIRKSDLWQILDTTSNCYVLIVKLALIERWFENKLIVEGIFAPYETNKKQFYIFQANPGSLVTTVNSGPYTKDYYQAKSFAYAFRKAVKELGIDSLNDALYIEQHLLLLPTFTDSEGYDEKTVFGTWLSGGVRISIDSFQRFNELLGWLPNDKVRALIETAGYTPPKMSIPSELAVREENERFNVGSRVKRALYEFGPIS